MSSAAARCTDRREARGIGCLDGVGVKRRRWGAVVAAAGSAHQQRQADNKTRQNAADQTGWLHDCIFCPDFDALPPLCL